MQNKSVGRQSAREENGLSSLPKWLETQAPMYPILFISAQSASLNAWRKDLRHYVAQLAEATAQDALLYATFAPYHLIIIDADCTTTSVVDLCAQICQRFQNPLLVVVPSAEDDFLLKLYQAGASECVVDPIPPPLLLAKIRSWLRWARRCHSGMGSE
jgi:DNA-binding response OmpR family regulator